MTIVTSFLCSKCNRNKGIHGMSRQVSQMTYQPKSVDKMADFETLTLRISLNSSQMCTYFCKDLVTGYGLHLVKNSIPNCHPFSNWLYCPPLVAMRLTSREIRVYRRTAAQHGATCCSSSQVVKLTMRLLQHLYVLQ